MTHILERFQGSEKAINRARNLRRSYPIHFYGGKNGAGKSAAMVHDTIPDLDNGTPVLSTVRLLDFRNPRPCDDPQCSDQIGHAAGHLAAHPSWRPLTDWMQLMDWSSGPVLLDEITGVADSNEAAGLPAAVGNKLAQLRRSDITVRLTGLNFIRANKRIREATVAITRCSSSWAVDSIAEDGSQRVWKQRRWATWRTYDAQSLPIDDISEGAWEKADHLGTSHLWLPTSECIKAYDTYDAVLMVGHVSEHGRCVGCGGNRRVQECACSDYVEKKAGRGSRRTATAKPEDRTGSRPDSFHQPASESSTGILPQGALIS